MRSIWVAGLARHGMEPLRIVSIRRRPSVLVVDADFEARRSTINALDIAGCVGAESESYADAIDRLDGFAYDALVLDSRVAGGCGLDLLDAARARYPQMPCIFTTGTPSLHHAVRVLKRGAVDYLLKPVPSQVLVDALRAVLPSTIEVVAPVLPASTSSQTFEGIVGQSSAMQNLYGTLKCVAPMQSAVLIQGETGTGKELIARTIHENSTRRAHGFVAFNAAAIPDGLAEAELFGHVKGAFTGAVYTRVGRFEAADRGTLFIDEVSSMSLGLQAKLLRALQEREIERVGTSRPMKVDVRVIAATNVDLRELVRDGRFREDLLYRINVVRVELPPLRERAADIPLLARHFVQESCRTNGLQEKILSQSALQALMRYHWPGNVRQLQNAVETAVVMSGASRDIHESVLPSDVLHDSAPMQTPSPVFAAAPVDLAAQPFAPVIPMTAPTMPEMPDAGINLVSTLSQMERDLILTYLKKAGGNKRQAARMLQLSRTTLIDKLHRLGVTEREPATTSNIAVA